MDIKHSSQLSQSIVEKEEVRKHLLSLGFRNVPEVINRFLCRIEVDTQEVLEEFVYDLKKITLNSHQSPRHRNPGTKKIDGPISTSADSSDDEIPVQRHSKGKENYSNNQRFYEPSVRVKNTVRAAEIEFNEQTEQQLDSHNNHFRQSHSIDFENSPIRFKSSPQTAPLNPPLLRQQSNDDDSDQSGKNFTPRNLLTSSPKLRTKRPSTKKSQKSRVTLSGQFGASGEWSIRAKPKILL